MKRICLLMAVCLLAVCFCGCGSSVDETQPVNTAPVDTQPPVVQEPTEPPVIEVTGYELSVPEGFEITAAEDAHTVYSSPNAPADGSVIEISIRARDLSVLELDEESFMAMYPEVEEFRRITEMTVTQVDGIPALFVDYTIKEGRVYTHIYEYHVAADENYVFRFCDSTDNNDWLEMYGEAAAAINMLTVDEGIQLDYSGLERYTLDCGISLYAAPGMQKHDAPGFTECIGSRQAIILVMRDNKEERDLVGMSLQEYADLVSQANDLESFTQDNYGNLHVDFYSTDTEGVEYFNNLTVKETSDSFWVFQMTCTAENQTAFAREFTVWATSIG